MNFKKAADINIKGSPNAGLLGATLGFFIGFASVALFGPTAVQFKQWMNLSPDQVALLVAMPALSGSLLRIPFSAIVDTTGGRKPFLCLLFLAVVGMMGLTAIIFLYYPDRLTQDLYPALLLFGLLCGAGIATFSVGISQVSYWFPQKKQGQALAFFGGAGNLAPGIFSFVLPFALSQWGISGCYIGWLLFLIFGTVLYFFLGRNSPYFQYLRGGLTKEESIGAAKIKGQELFPKGSALASLKESAGNWKTWILVIIYFTTFGGFIALTAWLPTYSREYFSLSAVAAGALTGTYSILSSLIRVFGGNVSDHYGGERTAVGALIVMGSGAILMTQAQHIYTAAAGIVLLAIGMGITNAAVFKLVPQIIPQAVGGAAGWIGGLGAFGGFVIPPLMSRFVVWYGPDGYAAGFINFAVLAVVSMLLILFLKKIRANDLLRSKSKGKPFNAQEYGLKKSPILES